MAKKRPELRKSKSFEETLWDTADEDQLEQLAIQWFQDTGLSYTPARFKLRCTSAHGSDHERRNLNPETETNHWLTN